MSSLSVSNCVARGFRVSILLICKHCEELKMIIEETKEGEDSKNMIGNDKMEGETIYVSDDLCLGIMEKCAVPSLFTFSLANKSLAAVADIVWKRHFNATQELKICKAYPETGHWREHFLNTLQVLRRLKEFIRSLRAQSLERMGQIWWQDEDVSCVNQVLCPYSGYANMMRGWEILFEQKSRAFFQFQEVEKKLGINLNMATLVLLVRNDTKNTYTWSQVYTCKNGNWLLSHHHCSIERSATRCFYLDPM